MVVEGAVKAPDLVRFLRRLVREAAGRKILWGGGWRLTLGQSEVAEPFLWRRPWRMQLTGPDHRLPFAPISA
jgi:hypothetical protein